jgi:hypothetical protein
MRRLEMMTACASLLVALAAQRGVAQPPANPLFHAEWTDGTRDTGELTGWKDIDGRLGYRHQPLVKGDRAVRWLRNAARVEQPAFVGGVEFRGGDFFPGEIIGPASGQLLRLQPAVTVDLPLAPRRTAIAIRADWIQRIVWLPQQGGRFQPQTAFLRDGRILRFRAIHWQEGRARLLGEEHITTVGFEELAELHLASGDAWNDHLRLLAALSPRLEERIVEVQAAGNVRVTTASNRLRPWLSDAHQDRHDGHLIVQPAWAVDGIAIPIGGIERLTFFAADEMPLTWLTPVRSEHVGLVSDSPQPLRVVPNAQQHVLRSYGREYAWGFGVHAPHVLEFSLPPLARRLEMRVGLDKAAGRGGCVKARVELRPPQQSSTTKLRPQESPLLIGRSTEPAAMRCELPAGGSAPLQLQLIADAAVFERPPAADPFEIRDFLDWLEPLVVFDRPRLLNAVQQELPHSLPALAGWSQEGDFSLASRWRPGGRPLPGFRHEIVLTGEPLILRRTLRSDEKQSQVVITANRLPGIGPVTLVVRLNERRAATITLPTDDTPGETPPITVDLSRYHGQSLNVELEFRGGSRSASFELLAIELLAR